MTPFSVTRGNPSYRFFYLSSPAQEHVLGLAGHIPTVCFLSSPLHVVGGQQCLNK